MSKKLDKEQYTKTEVEELMRKQNEELIEKVEVAEMVAEMTDVERAHYKSLTGDARQEFLFMESDQRAGVVKNAQADDPIVYKAANGDEFRKSDDPRLVTMAKERDDERKSFLKMQVDRAQEGFEKRAEDELSNLPGTVKTRAAIVKAIDGIEDKDEHEAAMAALKAHNAAMSGALATVGTTTSGHTPAAKNADGGSAYEELDKRAKELVKKEPELDYYTAFERVSNADIKLAKQAVQEG